MGRSVSRYDAVLPKGWPKRVRSAAVHAISVAHAALTTARAFAAHHRNPRVRLHAENDRLRQEVALALEEMRIKDARILRVPAHTRPHYTPIERLSILELRAARGWSLNQTAERLHLSTATVSSWMRRLDEKGAAAIVQIQEPVNKFPAFVGYIVRRLKVLCPTLGKAKIAQMLCRAGLHLSPTTVRRMIEEKVPPPEPAGTKLKGRRIVAKYPNHVWSCDLTTVPTSLGFWTSYLPFALPQRWPFCWWVAVLVDHYSRRVMGLALFRQQPTSLAVRKFLAKVMKELKVRPRHLVSDHGKQFRDLSFRRWCRRRGIHQRFGRIGQYGSIAVIERLILTIKQECTRRVFVPYRRKAVEKELSLYSTWYNQLRPHVALLVATPDEIYRGIKPAAMQPRFEPRIRWPIDSPGASPRCKVRGRRGVRLDLQVDYLAGRKHLPIISLKRVA